MKRFALFAGDYYYPSGGWGDFVGSFDTVREALDYYDAKTRRFDWYHIIDTTTGQLV